MENTYWNPVIKQTKSKLMIAPDALDLLKRKCERRHVLFPLGWKELEWIILYRAVLLLVPKPVHLKTVWLSLPSSAPDCPFGSSLNEQGNLSRGSQSRFPFHEVKKIELLRSGKLHLFWYFIFYFIEAQGGGYSASRGWRQWVPVPGQHQPCSPGGVLCHQREASRVLLPFGLRKKGLITPIFCQLGRHWANRELWGEAGDNLLGVGGEKGCQALLLVFLFLF